MSISSDIKWIKTSDSWRLCNGEEEILSLGNKQKSIRPLFLESRSFHIIEKGTWNPIWQIETARKENILQMKFGFWSSKGKISFQDRTQFECYFKNYPRFQIVIKDLRYNEDLISYQIDTQKDGNLLPKVHFHQKEMFTDKLLFLLALGMALILHFHTHDSDLTTFQIIC